MSDSRAAAPAETRHSRIAALAKIGTCRTPSFSPDGAFAAFVSDLSGTPQVWQVSAVGGWPDQVTAFDDPVIAVRWSPKGDWLAVSVAPGGGLNQAIFVVRPDGSGLRRLTEEGPVTNELGPWSRDGRFLAITSNRRDPASLDCYTVEVGKWDWRPLTASPGDAAVYDFLPDAARAVVHRSPHRGDADLFLVERQTMRETLLTPHAGPANIRNARVSGQGDRVFFPSNLDREFCALCAIRLDPAGMPGPVEFVRDHPGADLDDLDVSRDGQRAALLWNAEGKSELEIVDLPSGDLVVRPELPAEIAMDPTFSPDGRSLALTCTGAAAPVDIWSLEIETAAWRSLTRSPHAGVALGDLVRPELVRFPAADNLPLSAWLYLPRDFERPGPTVLSFHGGPEGQERPYFSYLYQALVEAGIAVLAPNVRGSAGFGKTFVHLDDGPLRVGAVRDILSCVGYATGTSIADPRRIGIMGGSYGGYMTMAGLTEFPSDFAAGADYFGIVNFETFFAHCEPWMAAISKVEYGDPETQRDLLRGLSPIHKIDRVTAATLVLHGANDTNVPVVEAEQIVASLRARNVPVEYVLFPDEGHGFVKERNRIQAAQATVDWFSKYLNSKTPGALQ